MKKSYAYKKSKSSALLIFDDRYANGSMDAAWLIDTPEKMSCVRSHYIPSEDVLVNVIKTDMRGGLTEELEVFIKDSFSKFLGLIKFK